jgi:hypothetical protein
MHRSNCRRRTEVVDVGDQAEVARARAEVYAKLRAGEWVDAVDPFLGPPGAYHAKLRDDPRPQVRYWDTPAGKWRIGGPSGGWEWVQVVEVQRLDPMPDEPSRR